MGLGGSGGSGGGVVEWGGRGRRNLVAPILQYQCFLNQCDHKFSVPELLEF